MGVKIDKVKKHLSDHRSLYIGIGIGVGLGVVSTLVFAGRQSPEVVVETKNTALVNYKSPVTNVITTVLERRGHPGNMLRCNETGELFASQNRAADLMGINKRDLSQHLHGVTDSVRGYTFTNLGEAQG